MSEVATVNLYRDGARRGTIVAGASIPMDGLDGYNQYLNDRMKQLTGDDADSLKGIAGLSFFINTEGVPTQIEMIKSLSPSADAVAKALIQNGPRWKKIGYSRTAFFIKF